MCIFSEFTGQKCCVHTCLQSADSSMYVLYVLQCMNPDVEFTVSKIVFYEILIMLRIKLKKKRIVYKALILI